MRARPAEILRAEFMRRQPTPRPSSRAHRRERPLPGDLRRVGRDRAPHATSPVRGAGPVACPWSPTAAALVVSKPASVPVHPCGAYNTSSTSCGMPLFLLAFPADQTTQGADEEWTRGGRKAEGEGPTQQQQQQQRQPM